MAKSISDKIKIKGTPKDEFINGIIEAEWDMFDKVNNQGGRADCQDDEWTFYVMRYSQHSAMCETVLASYGLDLELAVSGERNLVMEKYAYMMEQTDPEYFERNLKPFLPFNTDEKQKVAAELSDMILKLQKEFAINHPDLAANGRPLEGTDITNVSFVVYLLGELRTYSLDTLKSMKEYFEKCELEGRNIIEDIYNKMVRFYGFENLKSYEEGTKTN